MDLKKALQTLQNQVQNVYGQAAQQYYGTSAKAQQQAAQFGQALNQAITSLLPQQKRISTTTTTVQQGRPTASALPMGGMGQPTAKPTTTLGGLTTSKPPANQPKPPTAQPQAQTGGGAVGFDQNKYNQMVELLKKYSTSNINYEEQEKKALAELTPYYEKILKDVDFDLERAKGRLEEDYSTGRRKVEWTTDTEMKSTALTQKGDLMEALDALNKRGLLTTMAGVPDQLKAMMLSSGEQVGQLPLTRGFGGVAGNRLSDIFQAQQARREALEKSKQFDLEDLLTTKTRGISDQELKAQRAKEAYEQEKRQKIRPLADIFYEREKRIQESKLGELASPYMS